jgi:hypothetical protein
VQQNEEIAANSGNDQQQILDKHQGEPPLPPATDEKREGGERKCEPPQCEQCGKPPASGWTKFTSISQAAFAALLVGVGLGQIFVYMKQSDTMQVQADTMKSQLKEMALAGQDSEIEQRAFINVSELRQDPIAGRPHTYRFTPVITNSGNTPAVNVSLTAVSPRNESDGVTWGMSKHEYDFIASKTGAPADPDDFTASHPDEFLLARFTLGPKGTLTASRISENISGEDSVRAAGNDLGRFFFGTVRYEDVFKHSHVSKYCFRINGFDLDPNGGGSVEPRQDLCDHWNCTDQYCDADKIAYEAKRDKVQQEFGLKRRPTGAATPPH